MQAYINPEYLSSIEDQEKLKEAHLRFNGLKEMLTHKVQYNEKQMLDALATPGIAKVEVTPIVPGDVISENGVLYKVIRINDKGEAIKEEIK